MGDSGCLVDFKAFVDEGFRGVALWVRQEKAAAILSEALKRLVWREFVELRGYVFERLEK